MTQPYLNSVGGFAFPLPSAPAPAMNPLDAGAAAAGLGNAPPPATPFVSVAGSAPLLPPLDNMPPADNGAPPPAPMGPPAPPSPPGPNMSLPTDNTGVNASMAPPNSSQDPNAAQGIGAGMGVQAGPPRPPPAAGTASGVGGEDFGLVRAGGGMVKAHELERRGPSLIGAENARNQFSEDTINRVGQRNQGAADAEYGLALDQERQAQTRQAAAQQAALEQQEEMQQRQQDFDATTKQMSKLGQTDRGRFFASLSTPQKISGIVELMLSGFTGAPSLLQKRIDDDVKAQEFSYYAARDTANAKQTAFSMAMNKYQNADAARAAARAASMDIVQSQLAQAGAKWKGTETANQADIHLAALQDQKMMQIANGIQFVPAQASMPRFVNPQTGVIYSNAEAQKYAEQMATRNAARETQTAGIGGQLTVEQAKAQADIDKLDHEQAATGGLGKSGMQALALDRAKAQQQLNADLGVIGGAQNNAGKLTKGTTVGELASNLPAWLPGVTSARDNSVAREGHNRQVMMLIAGAYHMGTDANEPKNKALLEHYSAPYTISTTDTPESAQQKTLALRKFVTESAAAKGAEPPSNPASFTPHGKK